MTGPAWGDGPVSMVRGLEVDLPEGPDGTARWTELETTGAGEVGIWQIDPGTVHDVEVDEVFVVLSGRATILAEGSTGTVVAPGDVVRLRAGTATTWVVTERLRKVYLTWAADRV